MYGPGKVTGTLGTGAGASLPVLGFHYMTLFVFTATLLFASVALLTIVPKVRRRRARR